MALVNRISRQPPGSDPASNISRQWAATFNSSTSANISVDRLSPGNAPVRFSTGEHIRLTNGSTQAVALPPVVINGVSFPFSYLTGLMDGFDKPEDIEKLDAKTLNEIKNQFRRAESQATPSGIDWSKLNPNYLKLTFSKHLAPANFSSEPSDKENNLSTYVERHARALKLASKDFSKACLEEAFAIHALTDAFPTGHQINPQQIASKLETSLTEDGVKDNFLKAIAEKISNVESASDALKTYKIRDMELLSLFNPKKLLGLLSNPKKIKEEIVIRIKRKGIEAYLGNDKIDSVKVLTQFLRGVSKYGRTKHTFANLITNEIHDYFNMMGLQVQNRNGDVFFAYGDNFVYKSPDTQRLVPLAVDASLAQLRRAQAGSKTKPSLEDVWKYVPRPTAESSKLIADKIDELTNPRNPQVMNLIAQKIAAKIPLMFDTLAEAGIMKVDKNYMRGLAMQKSENSADSGVKKGAEQER